MLSSNALSYWADTSARDWDYQQTDLPQSVDVAVVGGGYTGLSAALHLAREGAGVALLESQHLGWGASGRNGGMVLSGLKTSASELLRRYGQHDSRRMFEHSLQAVALVKRLIQEENIECDFQETGSFYAAYKAGHLKALEAEQRVLDNTFSYATEIVPPERTLEEVGTDRYHGGLLDPCGGGLHPARYLRGLVHAADRAGARLHEYAHITRIHQSLNHFQLETSRGALRATEVVVATNGYTSQVTRWLQRRITPLGSYIVVTEPLDAPMADQIIPHRRMIFDSKNLLYYFRVLPDRRLLFGGRVSFSPTTPAAAGKRLREGMVKLFPQLAGVKVDYAWGGMLGVAFDFMPHAGQRDGITYSGAYAGHGVALATYMGWQLASFLSGSVERLPFSELPFPSSVFYRGRPWFLPLAGWWYRLLDWAA